jgi:hypothetical protein
MRAGASNMDAVHNLLTGSFRAYREGLFVKDLVQETDRERTSRRRLNIHGSDEVRKSNCVCAASEADELSNGRALKIAARGLQIPVSCQRVPLFSERVL